MSQQWNRKLSRQLRGLYVVQDNWRNRAACLGSDPDAFFPVGTTGAAIDQIALAKQVCSSCPVLDDCLGWAERNGVTEGVWGGLDEEERRSRRRRDARQRLRRTPAGVDPTPVR